MKHGAKKPAQIQIKYFTITIYTHTHTHTHTHTPGFGTEERGTAVHVIPAGQGRVAGPSAGAVAAGQAGLASGRAPGPHGVHGAGLAAPTGSGSVTEAAGQPRRHAGRRWRGAGDRAGGARRLRPSRPGLGGLGGAGGGSPFRARADVVLGRL